MSCAWLNHVLGFIIQHGPIVGYLDAWGSPQNSGYIFKKAKHVPTPYTDRIGHKPPFFHLPPFSASAIENWNL